MGDRLPEFQAWLSGDLQCFLIPLLSGGVAVQVRRRAAVVHTYIATDPDTAASYSAELWQIFVEYPRDVAHEPIGSVTATGRGPEIAST